MYADGAAEPAASRWEALCTQCGLCCHERERIAGGVRIDLNRPCLHLEAGSHRCRVYDRRLAACEACSRVTVLHAVLGPLMPLSCGYVRRYRRWVR